MGYLVPSISFGATTSVRVSVLCSSVEVDLCAANEDLVEGNVDELDEVADSTHDCDNC